MLISLNWIRDFVDLPTDIDPKDLAERFTRTTAEVETVEPIRVEARGLVAARVCEVHNVPDKRHLHQAVLDLGNGKRVETITAAPQLHPDTHVIYAPVGASVSALGEIRSAKVAGLGSEGMILPGDALGISMAAQEAIMLDPTVSAGDELPADLFDDWVIEVDNKSITHRPDLWGHYGIAREIAAIYGATLKPYPVVAKEELTDPSLATVEIHIADPKASPRYTALVVEGVPTQSAPLWMQLRLGHVGLRPISGLVDLTNYIMMDLSQPMHAFDGAKVDRIEVDWAKDGDQFRTLDGMDRALTGSDLMIKCGGVSVALAGLMGGLESEVTDATTALLLESANFHPATIRRTAIRLGLRTDASARFEKSLDPANTVLAIQRFMHLARDMYPPLRITKQLSDSYPAPMEPVSVTVTPAHVDRTIGRVVRQEEVAGILQPLGFNVQERNGQLEVGVPSYRATTDVSIEADVIEEIARYVGYNVIEPSLPRVSTRRFEPHALHELERRALEFITLSQGFHEIHGYLWYDAAWLQQLGIEPGPCVELKNPPADGQHRLRRSIIPGMLAAVDRNRFHFSDVALVELGSIFERGDPHDHEFRHLALVCAKRGKGIEQELLDRLKGSLSSWVWDWFHRDVEFVRTEPDPTKPWQHDHMTVTMTIDGNRGGKLSAIDLPLRRAMDEHLGSWSIAWAEIELTSLVSVSRNIEAPDGIPPFPLVEVDFSILVPKSESYGTVMENLTAFQHPLLKRTRFVGSFEGKSISDDRRSLTFRTIIGDDKRTLRDEDTNAFRSKLEAHLTRCDYQLRR